MKAAILVQQHAPLVVAELDLPPLGVGQVLVRVMYSGICGKQLDEISGRRGDDPYLPHLLGHEGAGVVAAVGPGVRKVKPGDHVVLHWMKGTGIEALPPQFRWQDTVVNAGPVTTFSEYTVVAENRVTPIAADVPLDVACLLGCAVPTGLGIVFHDAALQPGQSIAVFGVGGVGLNVIQGAALVNAYPIVAVDLYEHKLAWAQHFGATHGVNAGSGDPYVQLRRLSCGQGFDVTVDTTGHAAVRALAYRLTSTAGKTILAGVPALGEPLCIDSFPLHFGRQLRGSHGGGTQPDRDIPRYVQLYQRGKLKLAEQITHRYRLEEINAAIATVQRGEASRCVLVMAP
ncbi:MAG: dehydrogenase [Candidatus Tectimicrobiota bacterium]|nr:MAG: dehydrogenase [Candidatus Tectomicrobia bacterium]